MYVCRGRIPAAVRPLPFAALVAHERFVAHRPAHAVCELGVETCAQQRFAGIETGVVDGLAGRLFHEYYKAGGAVRVGGLGLVHAYKLHGAEPARADELRHLLQRDLVEQLVPQPLALAAVVVFEFAQLIELDGRLFRSERAGGIFRSRFGIPRLFRRIVLYISEIAEEGIGFGRLFGHARGGPCACAVIGVIRIGAAPVAARKLRHIVLHHLFVGFVEEVGNFIAGGRISFELFGAFHIICILYARTLVRIVPYADAVSALFEDISAVGGVGVVEAVAIVGRHVAHIQFEGIGQRFAGLNYVRLYERAQSYVRLFDAAFVIGRRVIQLNDVLAGTGAVVGDVHRHRNGVGRGDIGAVGDAHLAGRPFKIGVRKAVAEGEHDVLFVPLVARVLRLCDVSRFVVAVAHVHSLFVIHEAEPRRRAGAAVDVFVAAVRAVVEAEVPVCGVCGEVARVYVDQPARGVDLAREHPAEGVDARHAGVRQPHRAPEFFVIVGIFRIGQEAQLHGRRAVYYKDNIVELRADEVEHALFVLVQLQVMEICRAGQVESLAAYARDDHQRRVVIVFKAVFERLGVAGRIGFARVEEGEIGAVHSGRCGPAAARERIVLEERLRLGIAFQACRVERLIERYRRGGVGAARTGAAVDEVDGVLAEHRYLGTAGERKHVVLVFEQYYALLHYLFVELVCGGERFRLGRKALVPLEVFILRGVAADGLHALAAEEHVERVAYKQPLSADDGRNEQEHNQNHGGDEPCPRATPYGLENFHFPFIS